MRVTASLILCLSLTTGVDQTRPDFSGKWTKIPTAASEPAEILTITQTRDTLTIDDNGRRWVHKLDGSESQNMTTNWPRESFQISTSTWEADTLVTVFPIQGSEGPYRLRVAISLDGKTLVVRAISTSQTTGAVFREQTKRYSK